MNILQDQNIIQLNNNKFELAYNSKKFPALREEINKIFFLSSNKSILESWKVLFYENIFVLLRKYLIDSKQKYTLIFDHFCSIERSLRQIKDFKKLKDEYYFQIFSDLENKLHDSKLSLKNRDNNITWEWRAFWPENYEKIMLNFNFLGNFFLNDFTEKNINDSYFNFKNKFLNIKIRHDNLVFKPILQVQNSFTAYDKKKIFKFPLNNNKDINLIFSDLKNQNFKNIEEFICCLDKSNYEFSIFNIKKKIYRYIFKYKKIQVEFSKIFIKNFTWYSMCLESDDIQSIKDLRDLIIDDNIIESSYPVFLKKFDIAD